MIRIPYAEIISKIQQKTSLSEADVEAKVQQKLQQLSGLVSKEGAANIVASELGIKLLESTGKIKDVYAGMRSLEVAGKVVQPYEVHEFKRSDGSTSKVGSFLMGDETAVIRVTCWGEQASIVPQLQQNMIVRIVGAYCRENNGRKEIHCGDQARITLNPNGITVGEVKKAEKPPRKAIKDLTEQDENVELLGTVVQVFDLKFFPVCPQCNKRVQESDGQFACAEHKMVTPEHAVVLNVIFDDGTENMRCVFFRNQALRLLKATEEQLQSYRTTPATFEDVKTSLLGEQFKITGRVKKNEFFQRLEFVAQLVFPADAKEELERLKAENTI